MFYKKLIIMIKTWQKTALKQENIKLDENQLNLLDLAKKQTLLVAITSMSTIIFWVLQFMFQYGYFCILCDSIINISCIFLSLGYTSNYYSKCKCDKLSDKSCGCVERYVISKVNNKRSDPEIKQWNNSYNTIVSTSFSFSICIYRFYVIPIYTIYYIILYFRTLFEHV